MNDAVPKSKADEIVGDWVRWTKYEIFNGAIVPAQGSEIQRYDPWKEFRENAGKYRTVEQPYTSLLELHRNLEEAHVRGIKPSCYYPGDDRPSPPGAIIGPRTEADDLILAWCNQHGLLGLVSVLCNSIRPVPSGEGPATIYYREGGIWRQKEPEPTPPKAGFTWLEPGARFYRERPLADIEPFFRRADKEKPLSPPLPNTVPFFRCYGEPLEEFVHWCWIFGSCVTYMSQTVRKADDALADFEAFDMLSGLAESAGPAFLFDKAKKSVSEVRLSAGLFASYALMFLWDQMEGRRALRCENCDSYFISDDRRARYCSPRCRNTVQKRRSRAKSTENQTED